MKSVYNRRLAWRARRRVARRPRALGRSWPTRSCACCRRRCGGGWSTPRLIAAVSADAQQREARRRCAISVNCWWCCWRGRTPCAAQGRQSGTPRRRPGLPPASTQPDRVAHGARSTENRRNRSLVAITAIAPPLLGTYAVVLLVVWKARRPSGSRRVGAFCIRSRAAVGDVGRTSRRHGHRRRRRLAAGLADRRRHNVIGWRRGTPSTGPGVVGRSRPESASSSRCRW